MTYLGLVTRPFTVHGHIVPRVFPLTRYTWRTSEWSECRVDLLLSQQDRRRGNLTGLCGGGLQTREVYCVQANAEVLTYISQLQEKDKAAQSQTPQKPSVPPLLSVSFTITGRVSPRDPDITAVPSVHNLQVVEVLTSPPVENRLCEGPMPNRSQLCHLPCPIECQVSPWGAWGPCTYENCDDQTSKKGFELRRREIVNDPSGGPGSCPHLVEAVPCEEPSCWSWRVLGLEQCVPEEELLCGPGTQVPLVQCVNSTGEETTVYRFTFYFCALT
ncbi:hypothetical protein NQD34_011698 [Periophthalmus magnuspinnatus]|nr:hypothetical protein NQD34_011698 [Periophthalmus magnuspinnatus]